MAEFVAVTPLENVKPGAITSVQVGGASLALYLVDGAVFCTEDMCTHEGAPLSGGGVVDGEEVECPWHWSRFNVKTGAVVMSPATTPVRTFPVEVRENQVYVQVGE